MFFVLLAVCWSVDDVGGRVFSLKVSGDENVGYITRWKAAKKLAMIHSCCTFEQHGRAGSGSFPRADLFCLFIVLFLVLGKPCFDLGDLEQPG